MSFLITILGIVFSFYFIWWEYSLRQELRHLQNQDLSRNETPDKLSLRSKDFDNQLKYLQFEQDRIVAENAIRTTFFSALGGLFFIATAYFSWENLKIAKKNQESEKFSMAMDLLTHDRKHINLGGMYLLEEIADEEESYYKPVMEILSSYIRENSAFNDLKSISKSEDLKESNANSKEDQTFYRSHVQTIVNILGKGQKKQKNNKMLKFRSNLSQTDLYKIGFGAGKDYDFSGMNFLGANFQESDLRSANFQMARFNNAVFIKAKCEKANLKYANLTGANLTGANLTGANLTGANLTETILKGANFTQANLSNANFENTDLSQATGLTPEQISRIIKNERTLLPDHLK